MVLSFAIGPFVFGSPWMVLWGLAAAAPIIIHLWNRRKYNEMAWAAMTYLLAAMRKNSRRVQIEQIILLAVRAAVLLFLSAACLDLSCARNSPFGPSFTAGTRTHTVFVLDGSYSMALRDGEVTRFEQAQRLALDAVDAGTQGDGYTLVLMSDPPRVIIPQPAFDPDDVRQEIEALKIEHGGASLAATLANVEQILMEAQEKHPRLADSQVILFSDLGRTTWSEVSSPAVKAQIERLDKKSQLTLVNLDQGQRDNLAVTRLEKLEPYVTIGRDVTFRAHVRQFGTAVSGSSIELVVDGRRVQKQPLRFGDGDQADVAFAHRFEAAGEHRVQVRLSRDRLDVDNHRWLSVPVRESIDVLCISGKQGAARHVALALEPGDSEQPQIQTEVAGESALLERDLDGFECIFLCNVGRFTPDEAGVLYDYVSRGGGLVVFLGDQVAADSYNRQLGGEDPLQRLLPARIGRIVADQPQYRFDPRQYRHPIVSVFRDQTRAGLLSTPIWRYFRLHPYAGRQPRTALWFDNGDPAIVEHAVARGRVILVATAASNMSVDRSSSPPVPWTAMSSWHSFPPLVHEMLALAAGGRFTARQLNVGEPLSSSVHTASVGLTLHVQPPTETRKRTPLTVEGEYSRWSFDDTRISGIYTAHFGPPVSAHQYYAVNVAPRESDVQSIATEQLPEELRRATQPTRDGRSSLLLGRSGSQLFRYFLLMVFALLLVETFLGWRFGNK